MFGPLSSRGTFQASKTWTSAKGDYCAIIVSWIDFEADIRVSASQTSKKINIFLDLITHKKTGILWKII